MNYIMYRTSRFENSIFLNVRKHYDAKEILIVDSDASFREISRIIEYRPLISGKWLIIGNLDKVSDEVLFEMLRLVANKNVQFYYRIFYNFELYRSLTKSEVVNNLPDLTIINSKYPSFDFVKETLLKDVKKPFANTVAVYIYSQVKFNIELLESTITKINESEFDFISEKAIKEILPKSKSADVRTLVYSTLLNFRTDIPPRYKEGKYERLLTQTSGKKKKQYDLLDSIEIKPEQLLIFIVETLSAMKKVKRCYNSLVFNESNIFNRKEDLEKQFKFLKYLTIPTIRNYIFVGKEVTMQDIDYCLLQFVSLRRNDEITKDDIALALFKCLNRHEIIK